MRVEHHKLKRTEDIPTSESGVKNKIKKFKIKQIKSLTLSCSHCSRQVATGPGKHVLHWKS